MPTQKKPQVILHKEKGLPFPGPDSEWPKTDSFELDGTIVTKERRVAAEERRKDERRKENRPAPFAIASECGWGWWHLRNDDYKTHELAVAAAAVLLHDKELCHKEYAVVRRPDRRKIKQRAADHYPDWEQRGGAERPELPHEKED